MRKPSVKTLEAAFPGFGRQLRAILDMNRKQLIATDAGDAFNRACFHPPQSYRLRMEALNAAGEFFGVEYAESTQGEYAEYLNAGDSYAPTIIRWRGNYRVQSIGDFVETMERRGIRFN